MKTCCYADGIVKFCTTHKVKCVAYFAKLHDTKHPFAWRANFTCRKADLVKKARRSVLFSGTPERIRTSDLPLRRRPLYPAELRMQMPEYCNGKSGNCQINSARRLSQFSNLFLGTAKVISQPAISQVPMSGLLIWAICIVRVLPLNTRFFAPNRSEPLPEVT